MTLPVGIHHGVSERVYHADPAPVPSLSHGIIRRLLGQTPRHAWFAHPRLNTAMEPSETTAAMEEGTILHRLVLGRGAAIVEIDADDYKKKSTQKARDAARDAGQVPVLTWKLAELERVADATREQLAEHHEAAGALSDGDAEVAMVWRDGRVWGRSLVDWLRPDPDDFLYDFKFTQKSAAPDAWERSLVNDYATQEAWYLRGARALGRNPRGMRFVVCESKPPFGLCVYSSAPSLLAAAEQDVAEAVAMWDRCLASNEWPGYPQFVCHVECPPWRAARSETRRDVAQIIHQLEE